MAREQQLVIIMMLEVTAHNKLFLNYRKVSLIAFINNNSINIEIEQKGKSRAGNGNGIPNN